MNSKEKIVKKQAKTIRTLTVKSDVRAGAYRSGGSGQDPNHNASRMKVKTQIKAGRDMQNPLFSN